jgi:hypothetical protein
MEQALSGHEGVTVRPDVQVVLHLGGQLQELAALGDADSKKKCLQRVAKEIARRQRSPLKPCRDKHKSATDTR